MKNNHFSVGSAFGRIAFVVLIGMGLVASGCGADGAEPLAEDATGEVGGKADGTRRDPTRVKPASEDDWWNKVIRHSNCISELATEAACKAKGNEWDPKCGCCTQPKPAHDGTEMCRYFTSPCIDGPDGCTCPTAPEERTGNAYFGPCYADPSTNVFNNCTFPREILNDDKKYCVWEKRVAKDKCCDPRESTCEAPSTYSNSECGARTCADQLTLICDMREGTWAATSEPNQCIKIKRRWPTGIRGEAGAGGSRTEGAAGSKGEGTGGRVGTPPEEGTAGRAGAGAAGSGGAGGKRGR
jgi:hypothetical protein